MFGLGLFEMMLPMVFAVAGLLALLYLLSCAARLVKAVERIVQILESKHQT
ncbi:hypothetical protein LLG96_15770 [bacterium]|nr:hypothetical protein [bacterium]